MKEICNRKIAAFQKGQDHRHTLYQVAKTMDTPCIKGSLCLAFHNSRYLRLVLEEEQREVANLSGST